MLSVVVVEVDDCEEVVSELASVVEEDDVVGEAVVSSVVVDGWEVEDCTDSVCEADCELWEDSSTVEADDVELELEARACASEVWAVSAGIGGSSTPAGGLAWLDCALSAISNIPVTPTARRAVVAIAVLTNSRLFKTGHHSSQDLGS